MAVQSLFLPTELVLIVLSLAAHTGTGTALAVARTSRATAPAADPALFHTVALRSPRALRGFRDALVRAPHRARCVANLGVFCLGYQALVARLVSGCPRLRTLVFGVPVPAAIHVLPPQLAELHLLGMATRDSCDFSPRVVSHASRLRVYMPPACLDPAHPLRSAQPILPDPLAPHLSHLALAYTLPTSATDATLAPVAAFDRVCTELERILDLHAVHGPGSPVTDPTRLLRVVLVQVLASPGPALDAELARWRAVVSPPPSASRWPWALVVAEPAPAPEPAALSAQWEEEARVDASVWDKAERVVETRWAADAVRTVA